MTGSEIPLDLASFLDWLKDRTEEAWADYPTRRLEDFERDGVGGLSWRTGTRWRHGLSAERIAAAEARWGVRFPPEYALFLRKLNCPDRKAVSAGWLDVAPYGMDMGPDVSVFSDWQEDGDGIAGALQGVRDGLVFDIEQDDFWLESWGSKPAREARARCLDDLLKAAPPLVPVTGQRFLVAAEGTKGSPILSIEGSDVIVYAESLRTLLLLEFSGLLGLDHRAIFEGQSRDDAVEALCGIPFWGDLVVAR